MTQLPRSASSFTDLEIPLYFFETTHFYAFSAAQVQRMQQWDKGNPSKARLQQLVSPIAFILQQSGLHEKST
jgi:hypothetical protein